MHAHPAPPLVHPHAPLPPRPATRRKRSVEGNGPVAEIRWGDQQNFQLVGPSAQSATGQLVNIMVPHPETYTVLLFARILQLNAGTGGLSPVIIVRWIVQTGVGSAQVGFDGTVGAPGGPLIGGEFDFIFQTAAVSVTEDYLTLTTPYLVAFKSFDIPSKQLLVTSPSVQLHTANPDASAQVQIAAMAAPRVYQPSACHEPPEPPDAAGDDTTPDTDTTWMPPGFYPEPVHYR
jgi:hypothetical protein